MYYDVLFENTKDLYPGPFATALSTLGGDEYP